MNEMSVIGLLLNASIPVQIVMLLLMIASLMSWSIIFTKRRLIRKTTNASDEFEANFWSGGDLNTLYQSASRQKGGSYGMSSIFEAGFREFNRAVQQGDVSPDRLIEESRRAMRVAQMREVDRLEQSLATLATIGSTSPYVGLFGTVFAIFGIAALLMSAVGLYGVIAFSVNQRRPEMSVRMAMGADAHSIMGLVLGEAGRRLLLGAALGLLLSVFLGQGIRAALFGVGAVDLTVYATILATVLGTGILAAWIPAYRAARADPVSSLGG